MDLNNFLSNMLEEDKKTIAQRGYSVVKGLSGDNRLIDENNKVLYEDPACEDLNNDEEDPKESNMFVIEDKAFTCESFDKYVKTQPYYGDFFVEIYLESDVPVEKKYTINFYGTTWVNAKNISFHDVQLALTYTKNALLYRKGDKMSYFSPMKEDYRKLVEIKHISFISYE